MNSEQLTQIISTVGFPITLIGATLWFFVAKFWPWYSTRAEATDQEMARRHQSYLDEMSQTREVFTHVIQTLDALIQKLDANRIAEKEEHVAMLVEIRALRDPREPRSGGELA